MGLSRASILRGILIHKYILSARFGLTSNAHSACPNILFRVAPKSVHPYLKLARLDTPTGTWLVYLPSTWSIALAAAPGCLPDAGMLVLFGAGALLMRGAGCTINDILDRDIDCRVYRTQNRPLANGSVSVGNAFAFLGLELSGALLVLLQLNAESILIGSSCLALVFTYPLFKRFTYWPQLMLGFTFNWGVFLGFSSISGTCPLMICLPLYFSAVAWTLIYDTVYAHQDINYDKKLGLKSTAILFGDDTKKWLSVFAIAMAANLGIVGITSQSGWIYFLGAGLSMFRLGLSLYKTDLHNPSSCFGFFRNNRHIGMMLFASIVLDRYLQGTSLP
uniref:4-hydroxybenzoate polyprenyltransferase, mitochondrial n=1 Tax=Schistocephalus solidus TaxID=70667 RepID=A0A0X3NTY4_SCHSO